VGAGRSAVSWTRPLFAPCVIRGPKPLKWSEEGPLKLMAAIDYVRFTSRHLADRIQWSEVCSSLFAGPMKDARVMQYAGLKGSRHPYFIGQAEITGRRHYMCQVSGAAAQRFWDVYTVSYPDGFPGRVRCTRLDLQRTIPAPEDDKLVGRIYLAIPDDIYHSRIVGSDATWTVYIGKRTGDRMARIYLKLLDNERWLRCEYELKGAVAQMAADSLINGASTADKLYEGLMLWNPARRVLEGFNEPGAASWTIKAGSKRPSVAGTISWIQNIGPALERHLADHDLRPHVETLVRYLYERLDESGEE